MSRYYKHRDTELASVTTILGLLDKSGPLMYWATNCMEQYLLDRMDLLERLDTDGKKTFLKDRDGNVVKSRLSEDVLQRIALVTGGMYVRSSGAEFGLDLIYDERLSRMESREIKTQMSKHYHERFQIPLACALFLMFIELLLTDVKRR